MFFIILSVIWLLLGITVLFVDKDDIKTGVILFGTLTISTVYLTAGTILQAINSLPQ